MYDKSIIFINNFDEKHNYDFNNKISLIKNNTKSYTKIGIFYLENEFGVDNEIDRVEKNISNYVDGKLCPSIVDITDMLTKLNEIHKIDIDENQTLESLFILYILYSFENDDSTFFLLSKNIKNSINVIDDKTFYFINIY